jgi:hypothetical protein
MHRLWLPPLDDLTQIGVDEMAQEFWGRSWLDVQPDSGLVIPIGRGDDRSLTPRIWSRSTCPGRAAISVSPGPPRSASPRRCAP